MKLTDYPLRRVVQRVYNAGVMDDVLDCGHQLAQPEDGPCESRRCYRCPPRAKADALPEFARRGLAAQAAVDAAVAQAAGPDAADRAAAAIMAAEIEAGWSLSEAEIAALIRAACRRKGPA